MRPSAPHFNQRFFAMTPIEEAIIELLQLRGPCGLDDVFTYRPDLGWGEVFRAIDQMSRDGRLLLRQLGYSTYQIALPSQFLQSGSSSGQKAPTTGGVRTIPPKAA
jgi:hypothetical protein